MEETPLAPVKTKSKSKQRLIGAIIMAVIIVVLAGALAFVLTKNNDQNNKIDNLQSQLKTTQNQLNSAKNEEKNDEKTESDDTTTSDADQIKAAYKEAGNDANCLQLDNLDIKNSSVSPYQNVTINCRHSDVGGGNAELFYRVSPTSPWRYLAGGQDYFSCDFYAMRKDWLRAFADETCVLNNNTMTVKSMPGIDGLL